MKAVLPLLVAALISATAPHRGLLAQHATSRGSTLVSGTAEIARTSGNIVSEPVWSYAFEPSHLYFLWNRVALGGMVRWDRVEASEGERTSWSLGPAGRVFFAAPGQRVQPYVGVSGSVGRSSSSRRDVTPSDATTRSSLRVAEGMAGLLYMPTRQVGVSTELYWLRSNSIRRDVPSPDQRATRAGLRVGFAAFMVP